MISEPSLEKSKAWDLMKKETALIFFLILCGSISIRDSSIGTFHGDPTSPPHTLNEVPVAVKDLEGFPPGPLLVPYRDFPTLC